MGEYLYEKHEKGHRVIASPSLAALYDDKAVPAMEKLHQALKENGNEKGKSTKVTITIQGKKEFSFSIDIADLSEIQEILQWTIGKD